MACALTVSDVSCPPLHFPVSQLSPSQAFPSSLSSHPSLCHIPPEEMTAQSLSTLPQPSHQLPLLCTPPTSTCTRALPTSPHSPTSPTPLSPPSSPTSPPKSPPTNGNSCHQCKTAKDSALLLFCSSAAEKGVRKRRCRKKYCESCLRRSYNPEVAIPSPQWVCPSCAGFCVCAACSRGGEGELSKEKISGGLQALAQMNPMILALLGIDERKLAHLQAVVNSPQVGSMMDAGGLLAMLGGVGGVGGLGMQELSLAHSEVGQPGMGMGNGLTGYGMEDCGLGHAPPLHGYAETAASNLRSASTSSTVSSPYSSSSSSSSGYSSQSATSSPSLCAVIQGQPSPMVPLPPAMTTPTYSPRIVSRSHTHAGPSSTTHSPLHPPRPRLASHPPPLHPFCLPTTTRHLQELDSLESSYQRELAVNRKRSWSSSLGEEEGAIAARTRTLFGFHSQEDWAHPAVKVEEPQLTWGRAMHLQTQGEVDLRRLIEAGRGGECHVAHEAEGYTGGGGYVGEGLGGMEGYGYRLESPAHVVSHPSYAL